MQLRIGNCFCTCIIVPKSKGGKYPPYVEPFISKREMTKGHPTMTENLSIVKRRVLCFQDT